MLRSAVADASPDDADEIRRLMAEVIGRDVTQDPVLLADTIENVNSNVNVWLKDPGRCVHLVARSNGQITGVVLVKDFWNLCSLFVDSRFQGQGIGSLLVETVAVRCAGKDERNALFLNAASAAVPFYRKLGFVERPPARPLPPGFLAMQRPL